MLLGGEIGKAIHAGAGCETSDLSYAGTAGYVVDEEPAPYGVLGQSGYKLRGAVAKPESAMITWR